MTSLANNRDLLEFIEHVATGIERVNPLKLRSALQKCITRFTNLLQYKVGVQLTRYARFESMVPQKLALQSTPMFKIRIFFGLP